MNRQNGENVCAYVGCKTRIRGDHYLCSEHYADLRDDLINQCPNCGRFKDAEYTLCSACYYHRPSSRWTPPTDFKQQKKQPKIEHEKSWEKADKERTRWFVYVLKFDNGDFYIGQTGELRERLMEHKDGKTATTKGLKWKLQYFEILPSRKDAEIREAELKQTATSNPRQIRRMIISFNDLVSELDSD